MNSQLPTTHATPENTTKNADKMESERVADVSRLGGRLSGEGFEKRARNFFENVVSWKDAKLSIGCCIGFNSIFLAYVGVRPSTISLFLYLSALILVIGFPYQYTSEGRRLAANVGKELVSKDMILSRLDTVHRVTNDVGNRLLALFTWSHRWNTLGSLGVLVVAAVILSQISLTFLCWLAVNSILVRRPVARFYRQNLSQFLQPHINMVSHHASNIVSKIPKLTEATVQPKNKKI